MKIKKFTARTFSEALELVKKELSDDAIILSTEETKGFWPHVEVTAAVDFDQEIQRPIRGQASGMKRQAPEAVYTETGGSRKQAPPAPAARLSPYAATALPASRPLPMSKAAQTGGNRPQDSGADHLKKEISDLRTMIEGMKNSGYEMSLPATKRTMVRFLRERSVREEYAYRLCDKTTDMEKIASVIAADIKVKKHQGMKKAVMLIGPTGVGKTTTIAKLAAQAVKAGKKAAIINLDTYRIGASEQARIYARILGIPLSTVTTTEEFLSTLAELSGTRDVVFVDTTGRSPRDLDYISGLAELCKTTVPMELHLLMSANTDDECMIEAYRSYRNLPIEYIAFTKIDEAVRYGALYNLLLTYQKPVAYLTTGQRVPGDIEHATVNRLASLIVNNECHA
ncbi:MAG: flagellar biosynthesis protein FlhF [Nitrospirae bacterium]|nr:flagellar biosynthesis protein FlhF [Nitrospirota bacterium]NTW67725.1 flagellar biosynthesis protein FlhF [Nitrospirota bacterium]